MRFFKNLLGGMLLWEGLLALIFPKRYVHMWRIKKLPKSVDSRLASLEKNKKGVRIFAGIEAILGLFLIICGSHVKKIAK